MKSIRSLRGMRPVCFLFAGVVIALTGYYVLEVTRLNREGYQRVNYDLPVMLRKFPFPFKAAIAISNDIDRTETVEEFIEIHRFLSTTEKTSMGRGLGLNVGNSFFFYEPPSEAISYFDHGLEATAVIRQYLGAGSIDVMHSYGKKPDFKRVDAVAALNEMRAEGFLLDVWIDHTKTMDNMGDDVTFGLGDHPRSGAYHADLTLGYGIKFVWLGRITMLTGQSVPLGHRALLGIYNSEHPLSSLVNLSKETAKHILAVFGNKKYGMHKDNQLVRVVELDDGQRAYEFMRFDNHWRGVSEGADSEGLAYVISHRTLELLKAVGGYMVVYTHLGKNSDCNQFVCKKTQEALRELKNEYEKGEIYVASTSRLLNYHVRNRYLNWTFEWVRDGVHIHVHKIDDPVLGPYVPTVKELEGITFYVPKKDSASIFLDGEYVSSVRRNAMDFEKKESISIVASQLE